MALDKDRIEVVTLDLASPLSIVLGAELSANNAIRTDRPPQIRPPLSLCHSVPTYHRLPTVQVADDRSINI
jgi:hypothetical protein